MTPPLIVDQDIDICLTCSLGDCDGGSPTCPWGRVHWQKARERSYFREWNERNHERRRLQNREYRRRVREMRRNNKEEP